MIFVAIAKLANHGEEITLRWTRDAWQASARPPIKERRIAGTPYSVKELTPERWSQALEEAQACLDASRGYMGRNKMAVTLERSGRLVEMWVSPHLVFMKKLWGSAPTEGEQRLRAMTEARDALQPLYDFVRDRSA